MASPIYVTFKDEQGSKINASVKIRGREGTAEGIAFDYNVNISADKNTGQLTAVRKHDDVILTKNLDNASPILYDACCRGKTLQSVQFNWYRIDDTGEEELYLTHILSKVKIVKIRQYMLNVKNPNNDGYGHQEDIHMRFKKIEINYPDGNIKAADEWIESRSSRS